MSCSSSTPSWLIRPRACHSISLSQVLTAKIQIAPCRETVGIRDEVLNVEVPGGGYPYHFSVWSEHKFPLSFEGLLCSVSLTSGLVFSLPSHPLCGLVGYRPRRTSMSVEAQMRKVFSRVQCFSLNSFTFAFDIRQGRECI